MMSTNRDTKVIGYFAYLSPAQVACDGDACMIAGSEHAMRRYLSLADQSTSAKHNIKKTRFGEIMRGMLLGGSYAFDEEAYHRFYPLATALGYALKPADFTADQPDEIKFMTVNLNAIR
jgi:hypothetical protein